MLKSSSHGCNIVMSHKELQRKDNKMRSIDSNTIFMVDYETDSSVVREYMTTIDYQKLLNDERNGIIKIMNHLMIGNQTEEA